MEKNLSLVLLIMMFAYYAHCQRAAFHFYDTDYRMFWNAYDEFKRDTTQNPFKDYIANTSGIKAHFEDWEEEAAKHLKKNIARHLAHYDYIRNISLSKLEAAKPDIIEGFRSFQLLYPEASIPDVHFTVGGLTMLSRVTRERLIIALDVFGDTTVVKQFEPLPYKDLAIRTTKGMIEFNSKTAHIGYCILREAVVEGSVCFITSLISEDFKDKLAESAAFRYGDLHEEMLVKEFLRRKYESDLTGWSYWSDGTDRPARLGAWIGFKITENYYSNCVDKRKAIKDILEINDFEKFLALSGYTEQFNK